MIDATCFNAPTNSLPKVNTLPYKLLMLLSSGAPVSQKKLSIEFDGKERSPLQSLRGDDFHYWNIQLIHIKKESHYLIDHRHLSNDKKLDAEARKERRLQLKGVSLNQAKRERKRIPRALSEFEKAKENALIKNQDV